MEHFETDKQQKITGLSKRIRLFTRLAFGLAIAGIIPLFFIGRLHNFSDWGEYIGGTTGTLWGFASIIFIYVAFLGQKQQLLYQEIEIYYNRLELEETRKEIKGQRAEMEEQNKLNRLKRFEDTFFKLYSMLNEVIDNLEIKEEKTYTIGESLREKVANGPKFRTFVTRGRNCFEKYYGDFSLSYFNHKRQNVIADIKDESIASSFFSENEALIHYFNIIYQILIFVEKYSSEIEIDYYVSFLKFNLSNYECHLAYYFLKSDLVNQAFINLFGKYQMLQKIEEYPMFFK